jgi:hypothetical protein
MVGPVEVPEHRRDVELRPSAVEDLGDLRREAVLRGREDACLGEAYRVLEDRLHVVVARDDPSAERLCEEDRLFLPRAGEHAMQLARIGTALGMELLGDRTAAHAQISTP